MQETYMSATTKLPRKNTHYWYSSDTDLIYDRNKKQNLDTLNYYGWTDDVVIEYGINSEGFRTDEFTEPRDILWIGCSSTFGVGIPEENTFADIVSKEMNMTYYNLSRPAIGWEFYYRKIKDFIDVLQPKFVFVVEPGSQGRREVLCDDGRNVAVTQQQPKGTGRISILDYEPKELLHKREIKINRMRCMDAIRWVCYENDSQLAMLGDITNEYQTYSARDLIHPGIEDHKKMSKKVLDITKKLCYK